MKVCSGPLEITIRRDTLLFLCLPLLTIVILKILSPARSTWTGLVHSVPNAFKPGTGWLVRRVQPTLCSAGERCQRASTYALGAEESLFFALGETIPWENS